MARVAAVKFALTSLLLAAAFTVPTVVQAKGPPTVCADSRSATVRLGELPRQGQETYELIRAGRTVPV
jgi:ribonuclease T1